RRIRVALEELDGRHNHAGGAEAALQTVLFPEAILDRVELAVLREAFDGRDVRTIGLHRENSAGLDRLAVNLDGAGTALRRVAPNVRAGETEHVANVMNQEETRLDVVLVLLTVDCDTDLTHFALPPCTARIRANGAWLHLGCSVPRRKSSCLLPKLVV